MLQPPGLSSCPSNRQSMFLPQVLGTYCSCHLEGTLPDRLLLSLHQISPLVGETPLGSKWSPSYSLSKRSFPPLCASPPAIVANLLLRNVRSVKAGKCLSCLLLNSQSQTGCMAVHGYSENVPGWVDTQDPHSLRALKARGGPAFMLRSTWDP